MSEPAPVTMLPEDYHTAIGVITVNGALMDQLIDFAIWTILRQPPERGVTVTKLLVATTRKIKFLKELCEPMFKGEKVRADFHEVYCKLTSAQKNRSKIVHAKWVITDRTKEICIEVEESDETQAVVEAMPLSRLQRYGSETFQAYRALEKFFLEVEITPDKTGAHVWPPRARKRPYRRK